MKNPYFIIKKQPNQTWEQWLNKREENEKFFIPYNWKFDKARKIMIKYSKKGLCKRVKELSGIHTFKWVGK